MRPLVLDAEAAFVALFDERSQHRTQVHVADAELTVLAVLEALEVHVADEWTHDLERGTSVDADALEIDRIEIHPDVRPVDARQDVAADVRAQRHAVMVLEHEADAGVLIGQAREILADDLETARRIVLVLQTAEEEPQLRNAELTGDCHLMRDGLVCLLDPRGAMKKIAPSARHDPHAQI